MDSHQRSDELCLDKTLQIRYWTRCLKTFLPHHYTGNESNRMYLAFFIISALDLLDAWNSTVQDEERSEYVDWIYHCQHPNGGFRMWPGTDFGERANESNAIWDPANIPATYFALSCLLIMRDDFKRVRRTQTLQWLAKMQRSDGSFGETLVNGRIEGGRDPRFGYCATGVRHILRAPNTEPSDAGEDDVLDINVDKLVQCINVAESFDGGIADEQFHEPHSGYTFCALGALKFMHRLQSSSPSQSQRICGPPNPHNTLYWLLSRQTDLIDPDEGLDSEFENKAAPIQPHGRRLDATTQSATDILHQEPEESRVSAPFGPRVSDAGMNGRPNKLADTCYAWWVAASTHMLEQPLYDRQAMRGYLLRQTQHPALGGFGKLPGYLPDLYHSYMGLVTLGLIGSHDVKEVDACMCISKDAAERVHDLWKHSTVGGA